MVCGGIKDDPSCVVVGGTINAYQIHLLKFIDGLHVIRHPISLDWNLWYETWRVLMFLPVIQVVKVKVALINRQR